MTHQRNQQNVVIANVSRRQWLKGVAGMGAFVLAAQFPAIRSAMAYATGAEKMPHGVVTNPHVFVSIDKDGIVTIVAHRAEMGNGAARTSLPMIIADELDAERFLRFDEFALEKIDQDVALAGFQRVLAKLDHGAARRGRRRLGSDSRG